MDYQEHKLFLTKNASTYRVRAILNHKILNGSWYSPYYDRTPHSAKKKQRHKLMEQSFATAKAGVSPLHQLQSSITCIAQSQSKLL